MLQTAFLLTVYSVIIFVFIFLPLGFLGLNESLEDGNNLLESSKVDLELSLDLGGIATELSVKVLAVRASAHGSREDGLNQEAVVRLQGDGVGCAEGVRELLVRLGDVLGDTDGSELESTSCYAY